MTSRYASPPRATGAMLAAPPRRSSLRAAVLIALVAAGVRAAAPPGDTRGGTPKRARLEATLKKTDEALERAATATEQGRLLAIRGQVLLALGQAEQARSAFAAAIRKEPAVELDAAYADPEAMRVFDGARRELPATVSVTIKRGTGVVTVDERDLGPAPLQAQLPGGLHQLRVRAPSGRTTRFEVQVTPGRRVLLELELDGARTPKSRAATATVRRVMEKWAPPVLAAMELADVPDAPGSSDAPEAAVLPPPRVERESPLRSPPAARPRRAWSYAMGGIGLALAAGGAGFGIATLEEARLARASFALSAPHAQHASNASTFAIVADVFYGASAVAAVAAVWLFLSDALHPPAAAPAAIGLAPVPLPGGMALGVTGAF